MNITKLASSRTRHFLQKYPGGFMHPEMQKMGKKHKMEQMVELTQQSFAKAKFR